jgi:hypothetical protein
MMKKALTAPFIYPYWFRFLGLVVILGGILIFFNRASKYDIVDLAGGSFPMAMGLMFIFFSKEKSFDERIAYLKFKALAFAIPVAATVVMAINYSKNFGGYSIETDSWYSISAFEYLSIALALALGWFHFLKIKE